ncbi:MAG TPA: hypothetical protein VKD72_31200, partial [Gemmataceae bacterium]|nr:hypothetical protein [Gemmataceae bacterium]
PGERRRAGSARRDPKPPASGEGDMFSDDHSNLLVPRRMPADRIRCEADHFLRLCEVLFKDLKGPLGLGGYQVLRQPTETRATTHAGSGPAKKGTRTM